MIKMEVFKKMPKPWFKELKSLEEMREYPDLFPDVMEDLKAGGRKASCSTDLFFFNKLAKSGFKALAHGGVLPIHWDVENNKGYWLPKNTPPTKGVMVNGKEFGWSDPDVMAPDLVTA